MMRRPSTRLSLPAGLLLLAGLTFAAPPQPSDPLAGSLVGFVSDQTGVPQMGAAVLLYNTYDRMVGRSLTNEKGAFGFDSLLPGNYSIRVTLASFVPAVKENIRIQPGMRSFLSISLASVLSSIELIYSAPGETKIMSDDWKWVLRTATESRPVLRITPVPDISDPTGGHKSTSAIFSHTRGLVKLSTGEEGSLAAAGAQTDLGTAFALATTLFGGNELQFTGNLGYASNTGTPTAGFRTSYSSELWGAKPEVSLTMRQAFLQGHVGSAFLGGINAETPQMKTMSVSTLDRRQLGDRIRFEYGGSMESVAFLERLNYFSPFARLTYDLPAVGSLQFAYNSGMPPAELLVSAEGQENDLRNDLTVLALFPRVSLVGGDVRVQRTTNFEMAYRRAVGSRLLSVGAYRESVSNSAVMMAAPAGYYPGGDLLPDLSSNSSVFNMGRFERVGFMAAGTQKLGESLSLTAAVGNSGVLVSDLPFLQTNDPAELRDAWRNSRRTWLAARASGASPWTGTRFSASYQWTDYTTLLPTHLYLTQVLQPELGLNIRIRQSLPAFGFWAGRLEATAELRNLLAQGYIPVSTSDGRRLYLVQNPRAVRGGLAFIF